MIHTQNRPHQYVTAIEHIEMSRNHISFQLIPEFPILKSHLPAIFLGPSRDPRGDPRGFPGGPWGPPRRGSPLPSSAPRPVPRPSPAGSGASPGESLAPPGPGNEERLWDAMGIPVKGTIVTYHIERILLEVSLIKDPKRIKN